jgi:hypothetical protein
MRYAFALLLLLLPLTAAAQSECLTAATPSTKTMIFPDGLDLTPGDTLRARSAERDLCAGEAVVDSAATGLTIRGDDAFPDTLGFEPGEAYDIYVADGTGETRLILTADMDGAGPRVDVTEYIADALYVVETLTYVEPAAGVTLMLSPDVIETTATNWGTTLTTQLPEGDTLRAIHLEIKGAQSTDQVLAQGFNMLELQGDTLLFAGLGLNATSGTVASIQGQTGGGRTLTVTGVNAVVESSGEMQEVDLTVTPELLEVISVLLGDITGDGEITLADVEAALLYLLLCPDYGSCLTDAEIDRGDMSGDGAVTLLDAALIYQLTDE